MSFIELLNESFPVLLAGMGLTLQLTIVSLLFAVVLGLISCFFKISKIKALNIISTIYVDAIRGTPLLCQAFLIYFGVPQAIREYLHLTSFKMGAFTAGVIVLSLNAGAYLSEIFRSGIDAVNVGQMEAARSLGLPYSVAMRKVILPQAFRIVTPSVVNQFIITLKDTTLISVIGVKELMQSGKIIIARNMESFKIYLIIAVMYFVVIFALTKVSNLIERRLSNNAKGTRKKPA